MHLPSTLKPLLLCLACLFCHNAAIFSQTAGRTTYYKDSDGDGFGDLAKPKTSNSPVRGYVLNALDCNDRDKTISPGATEGRDGKENDCDGMTDEVSFYQDNDSDRFGSAVAKEAVAQPVGYAASSGDCDDTADKIYPGAAETCDGKDNNCDGGIDEGVKTTFYADADSDGFGNPDAAAEACTAPDGYVANNTDANDTDNTIYPNATEICDNKDNDQDGQTDEGLVLNTYYRDADGDRRGNAEITVLACTRPAGYSAEPGDCNDNDASIYPGAFEQCGEGKDNNCNGTVDDTRTYYRDYDGDGYGGSFGSKVSCPGWMDTLPGVGIATTMTRV